MAKEGWYVTVGSDHSDRELEKVAIDKAKQVCQKVLATQVWRHTEVKDHWDEIKINAKVVKDNVECVYQEGKLGALESTSRRSESSGM